MAELVKSIAEIFSNRVFYIPDYQRGYAWTKKQWDDLIQDLELLPERRNHFTGTLILRPTSNSQTKLIDEEGRAYFKFDVIDGQQRLTTAVLFLKAIYDEMVLLPDLKTLANGLREMYLINLDLIGQPFTKLTLNRDCRDFFSHNILGFNNDIQGPIIRSHRLLADGKIHFSKYLEGQHSALGDQFPIWLKELYFKLTQYLTLIVYEVDNELDAGVIFETMNDRGRPLTELEKVKNYLLYVSSKLNLASDHHLDQLINQTWTHIFEELMEAEISDSDNEDQLLRAHWLTVYDYNAQNWNKSRTIKEKFNLRTYLGKHTQLLKDLTEYLTTLKNATTAYCDLNRPTRQGAFNEFMDASIRQKTVYYSEKLARLGARASFHPILLAVRLKATDNGSTYLQVVQACEKFDFRVYQWMRRQPRAGQSQLFRLANEYFKSCNSQALLFYINETSNYYCTNSQFEQRFELETEDWYRWGGLKYFLYEYEQFFADQAGVKVRMPWEALMNSRKEDTIEHILPQTVEDSYWQNRFDRTARKRWVNDIGNLTLTYVNPEMQNKPFRKGEKLNDDKVSYYKESSLFIERCLKDFLDWDIEAIQIRREQIRKWALERWKITEVSPITPPGAKGPAAGEKGSMEKFQNAAEQLGNGEIFARVILELQKFPLHTRLNPQWMGISFTPRSDKRQKIFWLEPSMFLAIGFEEMENHFGIPADRVEEIIGPPRRKIKSDNIEDFLARLELLRREFPNSNGD